MTTRAGLERKVAHLNACNGPQAEQMELDYSSTYSYRLTSRNGSKDLTPRMTRPNMEHTLNGMLLLLRIQGGKA